MKGDGSLSRLVKKGNKKKNECMKVVYISSPMKVKTSASRFRSLVQQLTGKNSDISQYMDEEDVKYGAKEFHHDIELDLNQRTSAKETSDQYQTYSTSISADDTVTSTDDSFPGLAMDSINNAFTSQMREQFAEIFESNSFYDPSQLDVLGSFDELL